MSGHKNLTELMNYDLYSYFYGLVRQIPEGKVTTYGALARALGDIVASRACGYMLSLSRGNGQVPDYRVVRSDGYVGKYAHEQNSDERARKLNSEGFTLVNGKIQDFEKHLFDEFKTEYPLNAMREEQSRLSEKVSLDDDFSAESVAAIDVSYDDRYGYGVMAIRKDSGYEYRTVVQGVRFPYIPGYLAYREFNFIQALASGFDGLLLIDASGYLHPRHIGLASFAGVVMDMPTIGISKSMLIGRSEGNWIYNNGERSGYIVNKREIVSPGHRISLDSSVRFIKDNYGDRYPAILKDVHNHTVKLRISAPRQSV